MHVSGTPVAAPGPRTEPFDNPDKITADDALGDLILFNPCSVFDPDALPDEWVVVLAVPVAFEDCEITVTAHGKSIEVQVGYLYETDYDVDEHQDGARDGGITVIPADVDDGSCTRDIVFADGIALVVRSWEDSGSQDGLCEVSDAVVDVVLDSVMAHEAAPLELPEDSIGEVDPCTLVTQDLIALVPGLTGVEPSHQVSGHSCWWASDGAPALNVEFEIGKQPVGESGEEIQGRYTATTAYRDEADSSLCSVTGEHVPFEVEGEHGIMELVGLYVYQPPGQAEQACAIGKQLADKLWQKLPDL